MQEAPDPTTRLALARVGQTLRGKWHLDALLGVGGMACVYAATHRNGAKGALKILHREQSLDPGNRERFLREGYVANRVGHPGVVAIIDDDVSDDAAVYLVMELLQGETLSARASSYPGRRVPIPLVLDLIDQLLDVLAAAHDKGIVHRDLKPDNLFLTREGRLKVLDFGIARMHEAPDASDRTRTGAVFGTPAFMPPEQALGETGAINGLTDLWAVGATLFTLLSGRKVREEKSANRILLAAMTQPAPPLASVMPDAPPALAALVDRALSFEQRDRFPGARAMQQAVRELSASFSAGTVTGLGPPLSAPSPLAPFAPLAPITAMPTPSPVLLPPASPPQPAMLAPTPAPVFLPPGYAPTPAPRPSHPSLPALPAQTVTIAMEKPAPPSRRGPLIAIAAAISVLLGAALAILLFARSREAPIAAAPSASAIPSASAAPVNSAPASSASASSAPASSAPANTASASPPLATAAPAPATKAPAGKAKSGKKDPWDKF